MRGNAPRARLYIIGIINIRPCQKAITAGALAGGGALAGNPIYSHGYAVDAITVNDKDGISAAIKLVQIATDLAAQGKTLLDLLDEIWLRHGFHATEQISIRLTDLSQVGTIMGRLRKNSPAVIAGHRVTSIDDLSKPTDGLPPTDGLRIWLGGTIRIIIRPSGTEAKMKCYIEVIEKDSARAQVVLNQLRAPLKELLS